MNQSSIEGNVKYSSDPISFKMEDDGSHSQGPGGSPSKPKESVIKKNETNSFRGDGEESIGIGYPVDEDKLKELKRRSKAKMEEEQEQLNDERQYEDPSIKEEDL